MALAEVLSVALVKHVTIPPGYINYGIKLFNFKINQVDLPNIPGNTCRHWDPYIFHCPNNYVGLDSEIENNPPRSIRDNRNRWHRHSLHGGNTHLGSKQLENTEKKNNQKTVMS